MFSSFLRLRVYSSAKFILCILICGMSYQSHANTIVDELFCTSETSALEMKSYSFNAKHRSFFSYNSQTEAIERGLTVIHVQSLQKLEFKTFDTYGTLEDAKVLVTTLKKMIQNKAKFAILAHDSAAASLVDFKKILEDLGFAQLSTLKGRQAYIMHNFNGTIIEHIDDISVLKTINIPSSFEDFYAYFPKITYDFEPSIDRYIAHAGGEVNGIKSTNTKEALDQNYNKGFRFFELDIIETADGHLVAAHDWNMWARFTDFSGVLPPTHEQFLQHKIYGEFTTLDMEGINNWFKDHPDATLVTDKINNPVSLANSFIDKKRLLMELFSIMAIEKASENGIHAMISQEPLMELKGDKVNFLKVNDIKYVALSRRIISSQTKLMLELQQAGIKVYVYNVNFDPGKDEVYVQENELGLVYGMYADKWIMEMTPTSPSK